MKTMIVLAALALASCKESKPAVEASAPPAAAPEPEKMEPNQAMKYVTGLQADVKRAQEKADAASKRSQEAEKLPE